MEVIIISGSERDIVEILVVEPPHLIGPPKDDARHELWKIAKHHGGHQAVNSAAVLTSILSRILRLARLRSGVVSFTT